MKEEEILRSVYALEDFLDRAWLDRKWEGLDMQPVCDTVGVLRHLYQRYKEANYEIEPRNHSQRRNAIDLGEQKNGISRQPQ